MSTAWDGGMAQAQATTGRHRVCTHLRGKAGVLEALALQVLRGDEDLGSALRLKAEELHAHLLQHLIWEEDSQMSLLAEEVPTDPTPRARLVCARRRQRLLLARSLSALNDTRGPPAVLADECLALVRQLEANIAAEQRDLASLGFLREKLDEIE